MASVFKECPVAQVRPLPLFLHPNPHPTSWRYVLPLGAGPRGLLHRFTVGSDVRIIGNPILIVNRFADNVEEKIRTGLLRAQKKPPNGGWRLS